MKTLLHKIFFLILLSAPLTAAAQDVPPAPSLKGGLPKPVLAKEFTITYSLTPPAGFVNAEADKDALNNKDFEITPLPCIAVGSMLECSFKAAPFALGKTVFSAGWIFTDAQGKEISRLKAADVELDVAKAIKFSLDKDIREIRGHYFPFNFWLWLIVFIIILAAALVYLYIKKRKKPSQAAEAPAEKEPDIPLEILSKNKINNLLQSGIWEAGEYKKFYFSLTDIFRQYLHKRFGLSAEFQTSAETLREIKNSRAKTILPSARGLLQSADLVKFAKVTPTNALRDADVKNIFTMIDETTPKEVITTEAEDNLS